MTGQQRILAALSRQQPDRVPTFEWFIADNVGQAMVGSRDALDIVERLDLDAVNIRADYTRRKLSDIEFVDEWGATRQLTGDAIAHVCQSPIPDIMRQADYKFPDPDAPHRFKSLERAIERFGDRRAIVFNLRDGFSDMRDLLSYEEALMNVVAEPELFGQLLDRCVDYNLALAQVAVKRYGVKIIATTDDVADASNLLMRPATYFEVIAPRFKRVIQGYKALGCKVIKHCDGNILPLLDFWIESGIDCLDPIDPGAGLEMGRMKKEFGAKICLKGNVDCAGVLVTGTPEEVAAATRNCILSGGMGGGLILSSSNTIHQGVKPGNYAAMLDTLRNEGTYPLK